MYTEQTTLRQKKIEDCLLRNMHQQPYSQITVSDLCEQTGISRKSFYRYFGNKDGCLDSLLDRVLLESAEFEYHSEDVSHGCPPEVLQSFAYWKQNKSLLDALVHNDLSIKLLERAMHHVVTEEKELLHSLGMLNPEFEEEALLFFVSGYIALILNWYRSGYRKSIAEMGHLLTQLITTPLFQPSKDM